MLQCSIKQNNLFNAVAIFTATYTGQYGCLIMHTFIYLLHRSTSKQESELSFMGLFFYTSLKSWKLHLAPHLQLYPYLLSAQLVVHLYPLHFLQTLLQPLVALPELSDVVTCFGQNAAFALNRQNS